MKYFATPPLKRLQWIPLAKILPSSQDPLWSSFWFSSPAALLPAFDRTNGSPHTLSAFLAFAHGVPSAWNTPDHHHPRTLIPLFYYSLSNFGFIVVLEMPQGQELYLRVHAIAPSASTLPSTKWLTSEWTCSRNPKSKDSSREGVEGKTGKKSRTRLCR